MGHDTWQSPGPPILESAAVATRDHNRVPDEGPDNLEQLRALVVPDESAPAAPMRGRVSRVRDDMLAIELARGGITRAEAARKLGISERTVYSRLADPAFKAKIQALRRHTALEAIDILLAGTVKASKRLLHLAENAEDEIALGAARAIVAALRDMSALAVQSDEIRALNDRLDQIQAQQTNAKNRAVRRPHVRVHKLPDP